MRYSLGEILTRLEFWFLIFWITGEGLKMEVYAVIENWFDNDIFCSNVISVFSSLEKAEDFIKDHTSSVGDYEIDVWEVK